MSGASFLTCLSHPREKEQRKRKRKDTANSLNGISERSYIEASLLKLKVGDKRVIPAKMWMFPFFFFLITADLDT